MGFRPLITTLAAAALVAAVAAPAAAQGGGLPSNPTGENEIMGGSAAVRQLTPFEQFADKLKLDAKTQVPAVREIFTAAAKDAGPIGVELLQIRQKLLNVTLSGNAQDIKAVQDAYAATAAKMAGLEAAAFAKTYATLKPNQQSNATQAFMIIAGIFQAAAPSGGGRGQRGGGQ